MQLVSSFYIRHVSHSKREETREARSVTHTIVYIYIYIYIYIPYHIYIPYIYHIYSIYLYIAYIYIYIHLYIYTYQSFHFDLVDSCRRCLLVMVNECANVVKDGDVQPAE